MKADGWIEPTSHCQNGGDVCLAGNADGICCPDESCDIDDGMRLRDPRHAVMQRDAQYCVYCGVSGHICDKPWQQPSERGERANND